MRRAPRRPLVLALAAGLVLAGTGACSRPFVSAILPPPFRDEILSPIGVYADCGRLGDVGLEGEATVTFTVFVQDNGQRSTDVQVNAKMRTQSWRRGDSGKFLPEPVYPCVSTGRWEANLMDTLRRLVQE